MGFSWFQGWLIAARAVGKCAKSCLHRQAFGYKMVRNKYWTDCETPFSSLRHTSIKRAMKHAMKASLVRQLGRIKPVSLLVFGEEQLCDSHALNQMHGSMAMWALPQRRLREERCLLR